MASKTENLVKEVVITFHDKTKQTFKGRIIDLKVDSGKISLFKWQNAAYMEKGTSTAIGLRYVDITKVKSVVEKYLSSSPSNFDNDIHEVTNSSTSK